MCYYNLLFGKISSMNCVIVYPNILHNSSKYPYNIDSGFPYDIDNEYSPKLKKNIFTTLTDNILAIKKTKVQF